MDKLHSKTLAHSCYRGFSFCYLLSLGYLVHHFTPSDGVHTAGLNYLARHMTNLVE